MKTGRYQEQLDKYFSGRLKSNEIIHVGSTPEYLVKLGASMLDIVMKQKTLIKCTRDHKGSRSAHELSRQMMESLPEQIAAPALVVEEKSRNSFALISDSRDREGRFMLTAIKLNATVQNIVVNEVTSFYGRENLRFYLEKHEKSEVHIIDMKKAKSLFTLLRLQLPTPSKVFDHVEMIAPASQIVNTPNSLLKKLGDNQRISELQKGNSAARNDKPTHKRKEHT